MSVAGLVERSMAIVRSSGEVLGTAFRIAPGFAVTAAHVLDDGVGATLSQVDLDFGDGRVCRAGLLAISTEPERDPDGCWAPESGWDYPDLAVLSMPEEFCPSVPCALLSEYRPEFGGRLGVGGMAVPFERLARVSVAPANYAVAGSYFRFLGTAARPGMSGGPVYAVETGAVFGVVKATDDPHDSNSGGLGTPLLPGLRAILDAGLYTEIVLAHDRHHHRDSSPWSELACTGTELAAKWAVHSRLLGLLTRIPGPADRSVLVRLHRTVRRDAPDSPAEAHELMTFRDLAEFVFAEFDVDRLGELCKALAGPEEIPEDIRAELRSLVPAPVSRRASPDAVTAFIGVIAEVFTGDQRDSAYTVEVFAKDADHEFPERREGGVVPVTGYEPAKAALQRMLDRQLENCMTRATIEVAVPDKFLPTENLHIWRRRPNDERDLREFSAEYLIELRRSETWVRTREQRHWLKERWGMLDGGSAARSKHFSWLPCRDERDLQTVYRSFRGCGGLGKFDPPNAQLLEVTRIYALPLLIWRNNECTGHRNPPDPRFPCSGAVFYEHLWANLGELPATRWSTHVAEIQQAYAWNELRPGDLGFEWHDVIYLIERPGHHIGPGWLASQDDGGSDA